jgi:hypothetical protein
MTRRASWYAGLFGAAIGVAGCCTIIHGSSQEIAISSVPTNAQVTVDHQPAGQTPVTTRLSRKDGHTVQITLTGYEPFEMNLTRHTSGWVWGNIVFGGLIGLAVDAMTGALYELKPDQVMGQLAQTHSSARIQGNTVYVFLVATPDTGWTRIGLLERAVDDAVGR